MDQPIKPENTEVFKTRGHSSGLVWSTKQDLNTSNMNEYIMYAS